MSDKDRDAFEDWVDHKFGGPAGRHTSRCDGVYLNGSVQAAWESWQAARDHYASKLTEKEAIVAARDVFWEALSDAERPHSFPLDWKPQIKAALRAAGMRFKESGDGE